jgi:hypothetical protein
MRSKDLAHGGAQPALGAVTLHGVADLPAGGIAYAAICPPDLIRWGCLQNQAGRRRAFPGRRDMKELGALLQMGNAGPLGPETHWLNFGSGPLSAEALAALGATRAQDISAAHGGRAGAESMAPLADDLAGLICAFHNKNSGLSGVIYGQRDGSVNLCPLFCRRSLNFMAKI